MMNMKKPDDRIIWADTRSALENGHKKNKRNGTISIRYRDLFEKGLPLFAWFFKKTVWYQKGHKLALNIELIEHQLNYPDLPGAFHHFRILHLTDLHLDTDPKIVDAIILAIQNSTYDLCVITGDFRMKTHGQFQNMMPNLQKLLKNISAEQGIYATLGNHDSFLMVREFEALGIKVLCNETVALEKNNQQIILTGIDDVHYYFTDNAIRCLESSPAGFKMALVHSPELFDIAAENLYNLYLCGHTHGGQICLPGGKPIFTHLHNGKAYVKGLWKKEDMVGYTGQGCGNSGIPIRFHSQSEVTIFELLRI